MKEKLFTLLALHVGLATIVAQPVITWQPSNQTAIAGSTVTFTVGATGAPPLSYQWRSYAIAISYTNIPWGTEAALILTNVQPTGRRFGVVVTDAGGLSVTSSPLAQLTVLLPPGISQQPVSQSAEVGDSVAIRVTATGTTPLSYQWFFNGQSLTGQTRSNLAWISVQPSNAGNYSVVITNSWGSITSGVAIVTVLPATFTQITNGAIVSDGGHSIYCAWGDYDNDGFPDLFVTNADDSQNFLYHNNRDGTFSRIVTGAIVTDRGDWRSCPWMDYDNDGFLDILVVSTSLDGRGSRQILYRNNGDGTFALMPPRTVGDIEFNYGESEGGVWADYDRDGTLDLFVARYGKDQVFHNNGLGVFASVTNILAGAASEDSYNAAWADYNNDGLPDLFVTATSDSATNRLYKNLGEGRFEQVISGSIAMDSAYSVGCAWADYDNDGWLDLYVANGLSLALQTNYLYHNNGGGTFTRMTSNHVGSLVSDVGYSVSPTWGDYDNDGYIDLFVTRRLLLGSNVPGPGSTNLLYRNNGDGSFSRVLTGRVPLGTGESIGAAWADYDNDGFLDLFVARGAHGSENNLLYHNNGNSNGWIKLKLIGTVSNRSAIGAKVRVKAIINGRSFWQMRELTVGDGSNQSPLETHFGLGDASNIETVRIEWPSGTVQEIHDLRPRQFLTITEPPRLTANRVGGQPQFTLKGGRNMAYDIQTSTNLADWSSGSPATITNLNGTAPIPISMMQDGPQKFYRAILRQ